MSDIQPAVEQDKALPLIEHDPKPLQVATRFGWDAPARIATSTDYTAGPEE